MAANWLQTAEISSSDSLQRAKTSFKCSIFNLRRHSPPYIELPSVPSSQDSTPGPCPESIFFLLTSINHISRGFIFMLSFCLCQRSLQVFQHISCMNFWAYLICAWDLNSPSYPWFYTPNNIYWRAETMKFPYLHFFGPSIFTCILSVSQLYLP